MGKIGFLAVVCVLFAGCANAELEREKAQLHLRIGTSQLIKGHYPQALSELIEAEKLDPNDSVIQNNLGLAYFVRKEFELAEQHMQKDIQISPNYSDAKNNLGLVFIELARYDDAIAEITPVTRDLTYPTPEKAYVNLGLAHLRKGDLTLAQNIFKKSIETNSRFCPAYNYFGQALFQQKKYQEAIEAFESALKLCNNNYDEAHYFSALCFYKTGQREKAQTRLEEVIKLYPDSEYATKSKAMLKIMR